MPTSSGRHLVLATFAAALIPTLTVEAQSCRGLPELNGSRLNVGARALALGPARSLSGVGGYAVPRAFGELQFGGTGNDFSSLRRQVVGGTAGLSTHLGSSAVVVCPMLSFGYVGPIARTPYADWTTNASIGLAIGRAFSVSRVTVTPFVQVDVSRSALDYRPVSLRVQEGDGFLYPVAGNRRTAVSWLGQFVLGSGFRLNDRLTLAPSMGIPLERTGNRFGRDLTFGIAATVTIPR
jgi:hypothetical protein